MVRVLLVEDDQDICEVLYRYLEKEGGTYVTTVAHSAEEALELVQKSAFDIVLLDIMLPGMDGIDLCVRLRKALYCPIFFLSCLDDEETIVRAMRMGGDDYLTKPFRYPVLQAHMEAALRRMQLGSARIADNLPIGRYILNTKTHILIKNGESVYLSPTEFELLLYFYNNAGTVLSFEEIYQYIWEKPSYGDLRTIFSHVRNLRKKVEDDPSNPEYICTVPRVGYRFHKEGRKDE